MAPRALPDPPWSVHLVEGAGRPGVVILRGFDRHRTEHESRRTAGGGGKRGDARWSRPGKHGFMASRPSRLPKRKVTHRAARFFRILPGLRLLAGGNCYEAMREGCAPLLEAVLLCATEASAY
jgi:hypothetical protein